MFYLQLGIKKCSCCFQKCFVILSFSWNLFHTFHQSLPWMSFPHMKNYIKTSYIWLICGIKTPKNLRDNIEKKSIICPKKEIYIFKTNVFVSILGVIIIIICSSSSIIRQEVSSQKSGNGPNRVKILFYLLCSCIQIKMVSF